MGKLAVLGALVALSTLASVGPTFADDDGGGATDNSAAATPDTGADPALPAADPAVLPAADPVLPAADPVEPPDPFSTIQWEGTSFDKAPQPGSGPQPSRIGAAR